MRLWRKYFELKIFDIKIEIPKIDLKFIPQKLNLQTIHKKVPFLKNVKSVLIFKPTPQVHISKHTEKIKIPYLSHEFCYFLKLIVWPRVWWECDFGAFCNFYYFAEIGLYSKTKPQTLPKTDLTTIKSKQPKLCNLLVNHSNCWQETLALWFRFDKRLLISQNSTGLRVGYTLAGFPIG